MDHRILYDSDAASVIVTDSAISAFAVYGKGIPFSPADASEPVREVSDIPDLARSVGGVPVLLRGAAGALARFDSYRAVTVSVTCRRAERTEARYAEAARLVFLGYIYCMSSGESSALLHMSVSSPDGERVYTYNAGIDELTAMTELLLRRAEPFIRRVFRRGHDGLPAMRELRFPYREMRESQYEFITEAYRAIKSSSRLLVSAPTGTGKTISALYPAVRSVGDGLSDKIFCLCAKTTVGKAFTDAAELLCAQVPELKCVVISSKERCCPEKSGSASHLSRLCGRNCRLCGRISGKCAELRLMEAAAECLESSLITAEVLGRCAEAHSVCPHELSLAVSEYCDILICDYNYVFDFRMRLRRYFGDDADSGERCVLLADEVHNLPRRAADTYSALLSSDTVAALSADAENLAGEAALTSAIKAVAAELEALRLSALRDGESREIGGKVVRSGFSNTRVFPSALAETAGALRRALGSVITRYGDSLPPSFTEAAEAVGKFCHVCSLFGKNYTCFSSSIGDSFYIRLCCLDPSPLLDTAMSKAKAVIFFSATLTPISYYADILGCRGGRVLELASPFPRENLCPVAVDSVSLKLSEREYSVDTVAELIAITAEARAGNYLAFFPSFDYMERVAKVFSEISPDTATVMQKRRMSISEREAFLAAFQAERDELSSLVGFSVLGGIFSEGIDLPGECLIGVIIAGTGMPQFTSERNVMKEYFDETVESGTEYAYIYPGFNNVLQAAGRVIRTDTDRGVLVLIDSRYAEPTYYKLFPEYLRHIKYTGDPYSLAEILSRFWDTSSDV